MVKIGLKGHAEIVVETKDTARAYGSGALEVFATPAMIALMEKAALTSVQNFLDEGDFTVGTSINVKHLSATAISKKVYAESELIEIDRKRLLFSIKAFDDAGMIGEGTHERFIVNGEKFKSKTGAK